MILWETALLLQRDQIIELDRETDRSLFDGFRVFGSEEKFLNQNEGNLPTIQKPFHFRTLDGFFRLSANRLTVFVDERNRTGGIQPKIIISFVFDDERKLFPLTPLKRLHFLSFFLRDSFLHRRKIGEVNSSPNGGDRFLFDQRCNAFANFGIASPGGSEIAASVFF